MGNRVQYIEAMSIYIAINVVPNTNVSLEDILVLEVAPKRPLKIPLILNKNVWHPTLRRGFYIGGIKDEIII